MWRRRSRDNLDAFARKDVDAAVAQMGDKLGSREDLIMFMDAYRVVLYRINSIVVTATQPRSTTRTPSSVAT